MSPQKWELADKRPFTGPSGRIFDAALANAKVSRHNVFVTNLVEFFVDDNDLYSIPREILEAERQRVFAELDAVKPNCLLVMGGDTLDLLAHKGGIVNWRGSIFELSLPSSRTQKCVAAWHPAAFLRGQWKWLPLYKYVDVPRAVAQSKFPEMRLTPRNAIIQPRFADVIEYLQEARNHGYVAIDYEGRGHISCMGVGWSPNESMCIPLSSVGSPCFWSLAEEAAIWKAWRDLLESGVGIIAQNSPFEWIKSWLYGIHPKTLGFDTMHGHHCLYPDFGGITDEWLKRKRDIDNPGHGLALLCSQYTDQPFYKDEGRHWRPELGVHRFWQYNCLDVMIAYEVAMREIEELYSVGLWDTYCEQYRDLMPIMCTMEWFGVEMDVPLRDAAGAEMLAQISTIAERIRAETGLRVVTKYAHKGQKPQAGILNLASPKQMREFLYAQRGYKPRRHPKSGKITTDKDTLQALAIKHGDRVLLDIIEMREIQDLKSDIIDQPLRNGRMHCHYKLGGTNGTRRSSSESILGTGTNLQNIPRQGIARRLFLPD